MPEIQQLKVDALKPHPRNAGLYNVDEPESWAGFLDSIRRDGIIQHLVVDSQMVIVSGHRRYRAAVELGMTHVPAIVETYPNEEEQLRALVEFNRYRSKTMSEKMREAAVIEETEARFAQLRQHTAFADPLKEIFPEAERGQTRDKVAEFIGVSGRTYDKMKLITQTAETNLTAKKLLEKIDKGEASIEKVYRTLKSGNNKDWLDFNPKAYDYWFFGTTDSKYGQPHPGQIHPGIVENLLWLYTREEDLVVDPFAGGGITLDICTAWGRRCITSDIDPRRPDVRRHDIRTGYPSDCSGANLVVLDPPYWNMVAEDYSEDGAASYSFTEFIDFLRTVANETMKVLTPGGHAAFIIMKQHFRLPPGLTMVDWPFLFYRLFCEAGGIPKQRIYNMWPTSIWQPFQVTTAKMDKRLLPIMGDLCVFQKGVSDE